MMSPLIDLRYGAAAAALGLAAAAVAGAAVVERGMARAQRALAAGDLTAADRGYGAVRDIVNRAGGAARLLSGVRAEVAERRAAIRYWRGDYAPLLADAAAADGAPSPGGAALRIVAANAAYRAGQRPDASPREALDGLDRAIVLYAELLRSGAGRGDVAFNYEFLVRRRAAIAAGAEAAPAGSESPLGREGGSPLDEETALDDIRIYVPMRQEERDRIDDPTMGGDPPIRRRG